MHACYVAYVVCNVAYVVNCSTRAKSPGPSVLVSCVIEIYTAATFACCNSRFSAVIVDNVIKTLNVEDNSLEATCSMPDTAYKQLSQLTEA